jgi:hypothetical protein
MAMTRTRKAGTSTRASRRKDSVIADLARVATLEDLIRCVHEGDAEALLIRDRKDFSQLFTTQCDLHAGEAGDRPAAYLHKTHWALLDAISMLNTKMTTVIAAVVDMAAELEAERAKAKAAPTLAYRGVWKEDEEYPAGCFVTYQGSIWHVNVTTRSRPGAEAGAYTLAVKRGADGKDAQP